MEETFKAASKVHILTLPSVKAIAKYGQSDPLAVAAAADAAATEALMPLFHGDDDDDDDNDAIMLDCVA